MNYNSFHTEANISNKNKNKLKHLLFIATIVILSPLNGLAQKSQSDETRENRPEVAFKQRHSSLIPDSHLYADGIKIKRDLSILQEIQEERIIAEDEIPAEDLYEGMWDTRYAHVYGSLKNVPDTFNVDLKNFTMPIEGYVTSKYGKRGRRMHNGIDLKVQVGDTIYAAFDGKIRVKRFEKRGYGNYVAIRHPNGLETIYGHLSKFLVTENDVVKTGDPIALGGNTGRSTGAHLHLEFRFLGMPINPTDIVDFDNFVCHRDEFIITKKIFEASKKTNKYAKGQIHRIKRGDTLSKIARQYGTTISVLRKNNNLGANAILRTGTSLRL